MARKKGRKAEKNPAEECRKAFDCHAGPEGTIGLGDVYKVMEKLGMTTRASDVVNAQGGLRALVGAPSVNSRSPELVHVTFELFHKWYELNTQGGKFASNNTLLVKKVISKSSLPSRNLPPVGFVYGEKEESQGESAYDVVMHWETGSRSKSKEQGVSLIKVNKGAVSEGKYTAKQLNQYLKDHKNDKKMQRPKPVINKSKGGDKKNDIQYTKSKNQEAKEPMSKILFHQSDADMVEHPYANLSGQIKAGRLPKPIGTKSSKLLADLNRSRDEVDAPRFYLSKFQNVPCKVDSGQHEDRANKK